MHRFPVEIQEWMYEAVNFGAEKLLQQLKSSSTSCKRAAKQLKSHLQERYEIMDEEDDRFGMFDNNFMLQETIQQPYIREQPKIGRNEPCPCGSGKKFKKCCGRG